MKLYESKYQIVIKGLNHELIKEHLDSNVQKVLCVYDSYDNLLKYFIDYSSDRLALYQIYDDVEDEWIIERHKKIDTDNMHNMHKPWGIMGNQKNN